MVRYCAAYALGELGLPYLLIVRLLRCEPNSPCISRMGDFWECCASGASCMVCASLIAAGRLLVDENGRLVAGRHRACRAIRGGIMIVTCDASKREAGQK
jgi:hypothetical protein